MPQAIVGIRVASDCEFANSPPIVSAKCKDF